MNEYEIGRNDQSSDEQQHVVNSLQDQRNYLKLEFDLIRTAIESESQAIDVYTQGAASFQA
jgi:rubrerythrin